MKRTIPLIITFAAGFVLILSTFFPPTEDWKQNIVIWFDILAAIAFLLGGGNLLLMHLRKVSDRRPGWGYSGVTLAAFLVTLTAGLLKIGSPPSSETEDFGSVAVSLHPDEFPFSTTVTGAIPPGELPAAVYGQLSADAARGEVTFHGWMTEGQRSALREFEYDAVWRRTVDELFEKSRPPAAGISYQSPLQRLVFSGAMEDAARQALEEGAPPDSAAFRQAVAELYRLSNQTWSIPLDSLPAGIEIPEGARGVRFDAGEKRLSIRGPMSPAVKGALTGVFPAGPAFTAETRAELLAELERRGPITVEQRTALDAFDGSAATRGRRNVAVMFHLLAPATGVRQPLSEEQRAFLTADYNVENSWRATVEELSQSAHQTKFPWSGSYDAPGSVFMFIFEYGIQPLQATMFALLGFFVASAAFRAFRAKNVEATLLLGTAFLILLGRTYAGTLLTAWLPESLSGFTIPEITATVMGVFNTAGNRAIMIGVALGIVSTSLKILLGVDRSYLGSDSD